MLLQDPELDSSVKTRLLLLFFASEVGAGCEDSKRSMLASHLAPEDRPLVLSRQWRASQRSDSEDELLRRRRRFKDRWLDLSSRSGNCHATCRFRRWEPRLRHLIEEIVHDSLDRWEFPEMRSRPGGAALFLDSLGSSSTSTIGSNGDGHCVIIFVVGGITLPEARIAHEVSRSLGVEAFVGGSCLLRPEALQQVMRGRDAGSV